MKTVQFTHFFSKMDISSLDQLLSPNTIYMGVFKSIFLEKLGNIFHEMQERGDNYLEIHQGQCGAKAKECPSSGQKGYQFIGDHTRDYISLVFEQRDNGYPDFCDCAIFETVKDKAKVERIRIQIGMDELAGFRDPAYDCVVELGKKAIAEWIERKDAFVRYAELEDWVNRYKPVFNALPVPFIFYERSKEFHTLFENLEKIVGSISSLIQEDHALSGHPGSDADKEAILSWFEEYEEVYSSGYRLAEILEKEGLPDRVLPINKEPLILLDCRDIRAHLQLLYLLKQANKLKYNF